MTGSAHRLLESRDERRLTISISYTLRGCQGEWQIIGHDPWQSDFKSMQSAADIHNFSDNQFFFRRQTAREVLEK